MSNDDKRTCATILFSVVIVGAMLPNYLNIVQFFTPMATLVGVWWIAYFAALVFDAAWGAASIAEITGGHGKASRAMLVLGVVGAVTVNIRQAWLAADLADPSMAGVGWSVDAIAGHAVLPIIGFLAVHALAHYLKMVPPSPRQTTGNRQSGRGNSGTGTYLLPAGNDAGAANDPAVAVQLGVRPDTARKLRRQGDPRYFDALAALNGSAAGYDEEN